MLDFRNQRSGSVDVGNQNNKLVTADASDEVGLPNDALEVVGNLGKQAVAGLVTEMVVNVFETIEIDINYRTRILVSL